MEDNRNSDWCEEKLRHIIREEIRRSRANGGEIPTPDLRL